MDSPSRRRKEYGGEEGQGLFNDADSAAAPEDILGAYADEFADEGGSVNGGGSTGSGVSSTKRRTSVLRGRGAWKIWCGGFVCLVIAVVIAVVFLVGMGDGVDGSKSSKEAGDNPTEPNTQPEPAAPVPVPPAPTPAVPVPAPSPGGEDDFPTYFPTASNFPTFTGAPTRPIYWDVLTSREDPTFEDELMGSAIDVSADGSVVWFGSFNYSSISNSVPIGAGRIRRLDTTTDQIVEVFGVDERDSLGYQVCGSADGEFVAGFFSQAGKLTLWDYMAGEQSLREYASDILPTNWDYFSVMHDLSKDGQWLAVTGTEVHEGEPGLEDRMEWKLRVYQVVTGSGGALQPFGPDIEIDVNLDVQPSLYSLDMSYDGSVVAVGIVGVEGSEGRVRVYERQGNTFGLLGNAEGDHLLKTGKAGGVDDFYARRLQVRTSGGKVWLAIGWETANTVLIRSWDGNTWQDGASIIASPEFEDDDNAEFGYDFDFSQDATRLVIGVRCFNGCQGATQVFELNTQGVWAPLGQIVVGYEETTTYFGEAVAISGDGSTVVMGAPEECSDEGVCGGAVWVYMYTGPANSDVGVMTNVPADPNAAAPTPFPTAAPSFTLYPTSSAMPTYSFGWEQVNGVFDSVDEELFAAALSLSGDGTVLYVGAFENGEFAESSGRIVRVDLTTANVELSVYGGAYDFLGFDVSSSLDGNRVVGYLSSSSILEVAQFTPTVGLQQSAELQTGFNSTSATFSLSSDGNWLVGVGVIDNADGATGVLTVKTFQLSGGGFIPFGDDLALDPLDVAPTLDIHLIADGSYMAVSIAGWNGYDGNVRVFQRSASGWTQVGAALKSDRRDDFYGKTIRMARTPTGQILVFIGAPYRSEVLVYQLSGTSWTPYGNFITGNPDFGDEEEFAFDIDVSQDGSRIVVGVRCYDACRGAVQIFEYNANTNVWAPLGQIIAGFADSYFGEAVACDGTCNVIAVGAPEDCGDQGCGGSVYVFEGNDNRT